MPVVDGSKVKRRVKVVIKGVYVTAPIDQIADHAHVSSHGCVVQGCQPQVVRLVHVTSVEDKVAKRYSSRQ